MSLRKAWSARLHRDSGLLDSLGSRIFRKPTREVRSEVRFVDYDSRCNYDFASGYSDPVILEAVEKATLDVISGAKAYERDSVTFDVPEIYWPVWGSLQATRDTNSTTRVLDFGGALGSTFYQILPFIGGLDIDWRIVEQPSYVAKGRQITEDARLSFFDDIDDALADFKPALVYAGSSIQYLGDPLGTLAKFASSEARIIFLDKTPFSLSESYEVIQEVQPSIYEASYKMTVLSQCDVFDLLKHNWDNLVFQPVKAGPNVTTSGRKFHWIQAAFVRRGN